MTVRVEKAGQVWTVIHSRAEVRNAMDPEHALALYEAFREFSAETDARVAVLWGEGGAFCAGWDLKHAAELGPDALRDIDMPEDGGSHADGFDVPPAAMGPTRLQLAKPVIAAVEGPAVAGGFELALWCDLRVMAQSAYFGVYSRRWGIPYVDGGTVRLPRLVGEGRALDIMMTGRQVRADESLAIGLCEYVVDDGATREVAEELADRIATFPQQSLLADRWSVRNQHGLSLRDAMVQEWFNGIGSLTEGIEGAGRFRDGAGRHGDFG